MSVKAWFTISALILVALSVAVVVRLLAPAPQPEILARVGEARLAGTLVSSCWPQRGGEIRCSDAGETEVPERRIPGSGELELTAYPVEPTEGDVTIRTLDGDVVFEGAWDDEIDYDLEAGTYEMTVEARYTDEAKVTYLFRLVVS